MVATTDHLTMANC